MVPVNERYRKTVNYCPNRLIHKSQPYVNDLAFKIQKIGKKVVVQMKHPVFSRKDSISVINFLTEAATHLVLTKVRPSGSSENL